MKGRVIIVDDDRSMCEMLEARLSKRGFRITWCDTAAQALEVLAAKDFDVVVTDLNLKGMNGIELCERIAANRPDLPVVVITAFGSLETAVAAIRVGAYDFITKPFEIDHLQLTLDRAIQHHSLKEEVKRLRQSVLQAQQFEDILGQSPSIKQIFDLVERVAPTDVSVLISGESGTGKELVARAIHRRSNRHNKPFLAINCAAMPESLLESELFGHAKGAFTDAKTSRAGLFVKAHKGTLFFDEIGELSLELQPKLLRALQEHKIRPLGSDTEVAFDARIVAATNRDIEAAVEEKRFREDLFYRINVVHIKLPPLRARGADILLLAQHFVQRFSSIFGKSVSGISTGAADKLLSYSWPGNVRELQNSIERAVALTRFQEILVEDLPEKIHDFKPSHVLLAADNPTELVPLEEVERRYILQALKTLGGHKTQTAQVLGLDRKTLYRKLQQWGMGNDVKS